MVLREGVISPQPNPERPGRPVYHASSGLYLSTCSAWVTLPGVQTPADIILGVHGETQTAPPRQDGDRIEAGNH